MDTMLKLNLLLLKGDYYPCAVLCDKQAQAPVPFAFRCVAPCYSGEVHGEAGEGFGVPNPILHSFFHQTCLVGIY